MALHPIANGAFAATEPSQARLAELESLIEQNPDNLDHYFDLAKVAGALGEDEKAEAAYLHMLEVKPGLDRVRLDLALLYTRMEYYSEATRLLNEVLAKNPPKRVQNNINAVLKTIEEQTKEHKFGGNLTFGFSRDSNANTSSSTGNVTFIDLEIPLSASSLKKRDSQVFGAAGLNYTWNPGLNREVGFKWTNSATFYKTEQATLDNLDLWLASFASSPELDFKAIDTKARLNLGYDYISLDGFEYLNVKRMGLGIDHDLTRRMMLTSAITHEDRDFMDNPTSSAISIRTGHANQVTVGGMYMLSGTDVLNFSAGLRRENTEVEYYDNRQLLLSMGLTHLFPEDWFLNFSTSYKYADYDGVDSLISATTLRKDQDRSFTATVGTKIMESISWTASLQMRNVDSTIQNYDYTNQRISTSIGWSF